MHYPRESSGLGHVTDRVDRKCETAGKPVVLPPAAVGICGKDIDPSEPFPRRTGTAWLFEEHLVVVNTVRLDGLQQIKRAEAQGDLFHGAVRHGGCEPRRDGRDDKSALATFEGLPRPS